MKLTGKTIGFAITGSFCTFKKVIPQIENLVKEDPNVIPIMSEHAFSIDTRFGKAQDYINEIEKITGNKVMSRICEVEPIGPKKLLDILIVAPCTGNTLAKIANGISDTSVTLACKAQLRNRRPIVIAISTNDALGFNAKNIASVLNFKNIYFVPFRQDNPFKKPNSLVAKFNMIVPTLEKALDGEQIQPALLGTI